MRLESIHRTITRLTLSSALALLGCLDLPSPIDPLEQMDASNDLQTDIMPIDRAIDADLDARPTEDLATLPGDTSVHDAALPIDGLFEPDQATDWDIDATQSVCGNAIIEAGEECDGGPLCTDDCLSIECGNGRLDPGEVCDDGNDNDEDFCIDNCRVAFPAQWQSILTDAALENETDLYHKLCALNLPDGVSPIIPHRGNLDGRNAYLIWAERHYHWLSLNRSIDVPTRISINLYVPDGFDRKVKVTLAQNLDFPEAGNPASCENPARGPYLRHIDRKGASSPPLVRVRGGLDPNGPDFEMMGTGAADTWVTMTFDVHPSSGYVRFWYNGQRIEQQQFDPQQPIIGLRIFAQYESGANVGSPIGVHGLTIETAMP